MEPSANPVHGRNDVDRGRDRRARRADMVSALYDAALGNRRRPRQTRGARGRSGDRGDSRCVIAGEMGNLCPIAADRHERMRKLSRWQGYLARKPNFSGIDLGGVNSTVVTNLTWDSIKRLRDMTKAKLVLKGILAFEDAKLAAEAGIDAIIVSNHGGRVEDGVASTIEVLPEIVEAVGGRMPVLIDSGFRRGTDIVKALAIGAQAVCIGRPYLWGLGAFGQAGRRTRARNPAHRNPPRDATTRRAITQGSDPRDGAARVGAGAKASRRDAPSPGFNSIVEQPRDPTSTLILRSRAAARKGEAGVSKDEARTSPLAP